MLEIPVLGRKIGVRYISDKELNQLGKDTDLNGLFYKDIIYLSSSLTHDQSRRVLLHELAHALLSVTGLTNLLDEKEEEAICDAFENYLEVFRSADVVRFLQPGDQE